MMRSLGLTGVLSVLSWVAISGCGEPFTSATGGTGGAGTSTTSTTSSAGGMGGGGGDSTSSSGGMGGHGGTPVTCMDTGCAQGQFCAANGTCTACSDLTQPFEFSAPEGISITPSGSPLFPRVRQTANGMQMTFIAAMAADNFDIAITSFDQGSWVNGMFLPLGINSITTEAAPLLLPVGVSAPGLGNLGDQNIIVFTAIDPVTLKRKIYAANMEVSTSKTAMSANMQNVNDGDESYSFAMASATSPLRYWHMYRHIVGSPPGVLAIDLVTRSATNNTPEILDSLSLPGSCEPDVMKSPDLAPWARADGRLLLFHAFPCGTTPAQKGFAVVVDGTAGMPEGPAVPLQVDTMADTDDLSTPSLSPDGCTLYFSSDIGGERQLYQARRQ